MNLVRSETKEREAIKNNLIIKGIDENDYFLYDDLVHKCSELLNELHINSNSQTAVRLGAKRHDGSGRPIMLKLERDEDVHKVGPTRKNQKNTRYWKNRRTYYILRSMTE